MLLLIIAATLFILVSFYLIYAKNSKIKSIVVFITMIIILCFVLVLQRGYRNENLETALIKDGKMEHKTDEFGDRYILLKDSTLMHTFEYFNRY
jgi:hypothetical protein